MNLVLMVLLSLVALSFSLPTKAEPNCSSVSITLTSQDDVDTFQETYGPCDYAEAITIRDLPSEYRLDEIDQLTDITNLDGLSDLRYIRSLYLSGSPKLENVNGLGKTEAIFTFKIDSRVDGLTSLEGISHLSRLGSLAIVDNESIVELPNFSRLLVGGEFYFVRTALQNLDGLWALQEIKNYADLGRCCSGPTFRAIDNPNLSDCAAIAPLLGWPNTPYSSETDNLEDISYGVQPNVVFEGNAEGANSPDQCLEAYPAYLERDNDGDGLPNAEDAFPLDPAASIDTDGDGMPDEWNEGKSEADSTSDPVLVLDDDDDNDGVLDVDDAFPLDVTEWADSDNDGIGDNTDVCPEVSSADQTDTDSDGYGDACDLFPEDPDLWSMKLEDAIAAIEDENLRSCLTNPDRGSNLGAALQVTDVIAIHCNPPISTLAGIENFRDLRALTVDSTFYPDNGSYFITGWLLPRGELKDLSPLTGLHKMTSLTLMNAKVEDISPLSSLTGLTTLNLANSQREAPQITDISPLSQLIELRVLELGGHNISDISPLKDLNYLDQLWLYDNNISDLGDLPRPTAGVFSAIFGSPGILVLFINGNPIEDYAVMSGIGTYTLGISVNSATQTSFLSEYRPFQTLYAFGEETAVSNFDFVQNNQFGCIECGLFDGGILTDLVDRVNTIDQFNYLSLYRNNIRDLQPLANLSYQAGYGTLDLRANPVVSLWPLAESNVTDILAEQTALLCSHIEEFTQATGKNVTSFTCLFDAGDEDEDGVINLNDAFPLDVSESVDTDFDGIGDNEDTDDDNDTVDDLFDSFPLDATEWSDSDNDGVGDNSDVFPNDPNEAYDYDEDGIGDNADNCMLVANSDQTNTDDDAEGNECDYDDDNDGVSDEQELLDGTDPLDRLDCLGCYAPLDVDADGQVKALTDGLIIIRHLFGFSGNSLVAGALGSNAQRTDPAELKAHIDSLNY